MHKKYKDVEFTPREVNMFADLIFADEAVKRLFVHIAKATLNQNKDDEFLGVTVRELVDMVSLNRKVQTKKGKFEYQETNINRKHVERILDSLLMASLVYYRLVPPTKIYAFTHRGKQVAAEIKRRLKALTNNEKGDDANV